MLRPWWVGGALVLLLLLLAWRGCQVGERPAASSGAVAVVPGDPASVGATTAQARAPAGAVQARHDAAMGEAVSTLHRYLAALGEDQERADAFWAGGGPPQRSGEADLRRLTDLRALRIENGTPVALDSLAPPDALEIPVELRITTGNAPQRHYQGWYRLRRASDGWRITSAAIDASPPRR